MGCRRWCTILWRGFWKEMILFDKLFGRSKDIERDPCLRAGRPSRRGLTTRLSSRNSGTCTSRPRKSRAPSEIYVNLAKSTIQRDSTTKPCAVQAGDQDKPLGGKPVQKLARAVPGAGIRAGGGAAVHEARRVPRKERGQPGAACTCRRAAQLDPASARKRKVHSFKVEGEGHGRARAHPHFRYPPDGSAPNSDDLTKELDTELDSRLADVTGKRRRKRWWRTTRGWIPSSGPLKRTPAKEGKNDPLSSTTWASPTGKQDC